MKKRISKLLLVITLALTMVATAIPMTAFGASSGGVEWWNFRNNEENNGVTDRELATSHNEAALKWAVKPTGTTDWTASETPPLIVKGCLYTGADRYVYKLDKETGKTLKVSQKLEGDVGYAMNPLTYASYNGVNMLFIPISNGRIQCINADTMKSMWVSEKVGVMKTKTDGTKYMTYNQTLAPITYKNGYIYTGTWNTETTDGGYVCLSVKDDDSSNTTEEKKAQWVFKPSENGDTPRGFYWAGSYASDNYVVFGSDDGQNNTFADTGSGTFTDTAILYSVDPKTGKVIDKIDGLKGDIRTTAVYHNGYIYCATKGGCLYKVKIGSDGKFDHSTLSSYTMPGNGMMTAAPVVYNGRIYIGVAGTEGQFNADGDHLFAVLNDDEKLDDGSLAYTVSIPGYPQAAALLSTATEKKDGKVRLYFTYNAPPGGIYYIEDKPGQTSGKAVSLYTPETNMRQYCISTLCCDKEGTIYYKNDSCYLMAVEKNRAYLKDISVKTMAGKELKWDQDFNTGIQNYSLLAPDSTGKVKITLSVPSGMKATVNGKAYKKGMTVKLSSAGKANLKIKVIKKESKKTYTRTYKLTITSASNNAYLKDMKVSTSNTWGSSLVEYDPAFSKTTTSYTTRNYSESNRSFMNIWPVAEDSGSTVTVTPVADVGNDKDHYLKDDGNIEGITSGSHVRYPVYFVKGKLSATVRITVTSQSGKLEKQYEMTLLRDKSVSDNGTTPLVMTPKNMTLYLGGFGKSTGTLTAEFDTADESIVPTFEWTSGDEKIATVDSNGNVTAVGIGETQIWAAYNGDEVSAKVTVKGPTLTLSKYACYLYTCSGHRTATVTAMLNGEKTGGVSWKMTQGSKYASVSQSGKITAKKPGTAIVTATKDGITKTCTVIVRKPTFTLSKSSVTIRKGKTYKLKIKACTPSGKLTYKVKSKAIASVSGKGVIKGRKKGTTTITFRCNGISRTLKVKVR